MPQRDPAMRKSGGMTAAFSPIVELGRLMLMEGIEDHMGRRVRHVEPLSDFPIACCP